MFNETISKFYRGKKHNGTGAQAILAAVMVDLTSLVVPMACMP